MKSRFPTRLSSLNASLLVLFFLLLVPSQPAAADTLRGRKVRAFLSDAVKEEKSLEQVMKLHPEAMKVLLSPQPTKEILKEAGLDGFVQSGTLKRLEQARDRLVSNPTFSKSLLGAIVTQGPTSFREDGVKEIDTLVRWFVSGLIDDMLRDSKIQAKKLVASLKEHIDFSTMPSAVEAIVTILPSKYFNGLPKPRKREIIHQILKLDPKATPLEIIITALKYSGPFVQKICQLLAAKVKTEQARKLMKDFLEGLPVLPKEYEAVAKRLNFSLKLFCGFFQPNHYLVLP